MNYLIYEFQCFQRFSSAFQNTYFSENLLISLNTSQSNEVNSLCEVHETGAYAVELLVFMKRNFKINLEQEPLLLVMESKIID